MARSVRCRRSGTAGSTSRSSSDRSSPAIAGNGSRSPRRGSHSGSRSPLSGGAVRRWVGILFYLADYDTEWMKDNFTFIAGGLRYTVQMALGGIIIAIMLATLGSLARLSKNPIAYGLAGFYVSFFRGTPLIVQMFLVYLAMPQIARNLVARYPGLGTNFQQRLILDAAVRGNDRPRPQLRRLHDRDLPRRDPVGEPRTGRGGGCPGHEVHHEDAARRPAAGAPGDLPPTGNEFIAMIRTPPSCLPRRRRGERRDLPAQPAGRQGGLQEPRSLRPGRDLLLGADGAVLAAAEPARGADGHRLRARRALRLARPRRGRPRDRGRVVVRVSGLRKVYGHNEVLRGIDLELRKGEVIVIFGRSGSGKSTLLRCVNFLEDPTDGTIEIAGQRLGGGHRTRRKREQIRKVRIHTGMVFQQFNLFPHMTALENVMSGPLGLGRDDRKLLAAPSTPRPTSAATAGAP